MRKPMCHGRPSERGSGESPLAQPGTAPLPSRPGGPGRADRLNRAGGGGAHLPGNHASLLPSGKDPCSWTPPRLMTVAVVAC